MAATAGRHQTREAFATEAATVAERTARLRWIAPSRDEDPAGALEIAPVRQILLGDADEPPSDVTITVQGGRERGLVIHKLLEEVLTGETADAAAGLARRAVDLIRDLGREPGADPASALSADEMAGAVARTLALPRIAAIRSTLVPEVPVYGSGEEGGVELATFGIVDALAIRDDGKPSLVIDWKSDAAALVLQAR